MQHLYAYIYVHCNYSKHKPVAVNREIILHENIHVLNIRANKILIVSDKYILIWNYFQLYIIKITAYVLPIMTGYLAIATYHFTCATDISKSN